MIINVQSEQHFFLPRLVDCAEQPPGPPLAGSQAASGERFAPIVGSNPRNVFCLEF
jgi:hypothetical protein